MKIFEGDKAVDKGKEKIDEHEPLTEVDIKDQSCNQKSQMGAD